MKRTTPIYPGKKTARTVLITDPGDSFAVIQFPAFDGPGDGAEIPRDPPLTVQFLLSFLAQLVLRDKSCHDHHSLPVAYSKYNMADKVEQGREQKNRSRYCPTVASRCSCFREKPLG